MMMKTVSPSLANVRRSFWLLGVLITALAVSVMLVQTLHAAAEAVSDLSQSQKNVDQATAEPGDTLVYTIVITNSAAGEMIPVTMTDTLPEGLIYQDHTFNLPVNGIADSFGYAAGVLTWTGSLGSNGYVEIELVAQVTPDFPVGESITNTAVVLGMSEAYSLTAVTQIIHTPVSTYYTYLPLIQKPLPTPVLATTRPNANNEWTVNWGSLGSGILGLELQEAQNPDFTGANVYTLGPNTTGQAVQKPLSWSNVYYYRARSLASGNTSPWSSTVAVIGGYRDDFNDPASGWGLRRTSFLEKTVERYGTGAEAGNYIIIVDDRWDWMLASPMRPAPQMPYAIEYRARTHHPSNLISGGMSFAGDWNGGACPDLGNVYEQTNCFNSFYNLNFIFYGPIKLLYEQVDELVWCPTCGGSLLKRIGPAINAGDVIPNGPSLDWHIYRVEVRENGATVFINGVPRFYFTDTTHFHQPYFGVFASTDEYKPSIWFYDYFQVTPLD
jgi:uncharacterized repeat protein (TIGR01451 family)